MMWLKNQEDWRDLDLLVQLEHLRKYYCTGPCGQSSSTLATRSATDKVMRDIIKELKELRKFKDKWQAIVNSLPMG